MPDPQPHIPEMQEWMDATFPEGHSVEVVTDEMNDANPLKVNIHPHSPGAYEPHFPREGITHRVLAYITDEYNSVGVPRNTPEAVGRELITDREVVDTFGEEDEDGNFPVLTSALDKVRAEFDKLHEADFIDRREDGSYYITRKGWIELYN